jgi:hypothetical protein
MEDVVKNIKELNKLIKEKCNKCDCNNCPLSKIILETEWHSYDICDFLRIIDENL